MPPSKATDRARPPPAQCRALPLIFTRHTQAPPSKDLVFFFLNDPATTEIYPLSLHDSLPIFHQRHLHHRPVRFVPHGADAPDAAVADRDRKSTRLNSSHSDLVCRLLLEKKKAPKLARPPPPAPLISGRSSFYMQSFQ